MSDPTSNQYQQYQPYTSGSQSAVDVKPYAQQASSQYGYAPAPSAGAHAPGAIVSASGVPLPPRNAGWAVAALMFFWPVAFAAFNHVNDVYPKWAAGDYQGAQYASDRAKSLGKIALWIFIIGRVLLIAFYVFIFIALIAAGSAASSSSSNW